jgi:broad specificity phosphatase PhoE
MVAWIFLCHASEDKAQVREVYHRLRAIEGFKPWLDEKDLLPGQEWAREIPRALQASDFILIFFSRNSVAKRGYVQREMKLALDDWQEISEGTIHTIPVRLDDCDVPGPFRHYHWANLFEPNGFDQIIRAIHTEIAKRSGAEPEPNDRKRERMAEKFSQEGEEIGGMANNSVGTTVILIRHADRTSSTNPDPPLNTKGMVRAQKLIHVLGQSGIMTIYHSHFTRSKQTADPLAAQLPGIATQQIDDALAIKNHILANHAGQAVLVIGHSDTVPQLINHLSGDHMPVINESEFDNLFIVTLTDTGGASITRLKYGEPTP